VIRLSYVEVSGVSSSGPFRGRFDFGAGVQIVSAKNSYGKSLASKAIAWCLGVEVIFGIPANDTALFPDAVCTEVDFPEAAGATVLSSQCSIGLVHSDGRSLSLTRVIIGGDRTQIAVTESDKDTSEARSSILQTKRHTMQDSTGGFQHFFYEWMRWPRTSILTYAGDPSEIYLENLAPLFYIEQKEGWTGLQALQVSRYSQLQIREIANEYLLGATERIAQRVSEQDAAQRRLLLKQEADQIANRINATIAMRGWPVNWSSHGSVAGIIKRWKAPSLIQVLKAEANVDLDSSISALRDRSTVLRKALTTDPVDPADLSTMNAVSQKTIELKAERHRVNVELNSLRMQEQQARELESSLDNKLQSASDVLRLKTSGVGRLEHIECPTCHRDLEPDTFSLTRQSAEEISSYIETLKRDRALIRSNRENLGRAAEAQVGSLSVLDERLRESERTLTAVTDAVGTVREQLTKRAADLSSAERELDRTVGIRSQISQLQSEIDVWLKKASSLEDKTAAVTDIVRRRDRLQEALAKYVRELGHNAVTLDNIATLRIDEDYVPYLGARRLHALGSASDQSRLIAAYSLAIADASRTLGGLHPGFVVLDEPLQQNPDEEHRELLFSSLTGDLATVAFQLVIFTWLPKTDIDRLRTAGIEVLTPSGTHFLKLTGTSVVANDSASEIPDQDPSEVGDSKENEASDSTEPSDESMND
jgi:predicted  nucleic acid-binding Zn-ribbon protein